MLFDEPLWHSLVLADLLLLLLGYYCFKVSHYLACPHYLIVLTTGGFCLKLVEKWFNGSEEDLKTCWKKERILILYDFYLK